MDKFKEVELFANRYRNSKVISDAIKALGFTSSDFELYIQPDYIRASIIRKLTPYERKRAEDYIAKVYSGRDSGWER